MAHEMQHGVVVFQFDNVFVSVRYSWWHHVVEEFVSIDSVSNRFVIASDQMCFNPIKAQISEEPEH